MTDEELIKIAEEYKERSYSPYSHFKVGAAVLCDNGKVYGGCNIENIAYSPTICAERTALSKAVSEGDTKIIKIAIVGDNKYTYPCGVCRQFMSEFVDPDTCIIIAHSIKEFKKYSFSDIFPFSFKIEERNDV